MSSAWPAPEVGLAIYRRIVAGDPVAPSQFAELYLDCLVEQLRRTNPDCDEHARQTAAEDAILSVIRDPSVYDPTRKQLGSYLRMAAEADLKNIRSAEHRHHVSRTEVDCVELAVSGRNESMTGEDDDLPSFDDPDLAAVVAGFTEHEKRILELMRAGERSTAKSAAALGIEHWPPDEQAREVKRVKERIFKRLRRARGTS